MSMNTDPATVATTRRFIILTLPLVNNPATNATLVHSRLLCLST
jgi:hypothetical protein